MGFGKALVVRLAYAIALFSFTGTAQAALTFDLRTGRSSNNSQSMIIDSNQCPASGPTSMYVGGIITNTGSSVVTNIAASLTGLNANVYLAGGQISTQTIGSLGAGESIGIYWFTGYGCTEGATASPSVSINSSLGSQSTGLTLTIRKAISANAGGRVASATLGPGAVVGQNVYFDAAYDFGGSAAGDEFFLQPAGGQVFNAACFRLVGSEIRSSNVNAATVGTLNRLYFTQTGSQTGNGYFISIRYTFQYLCANTSTVARPYAVQTSGSTNIKYTGNFDGSGSVSVSYPGATNPFTINKSVSTALAFHPATSVLNYTVTISNPSSHASTISKIVDILPAGVSFAALDNSGNVTATNSSSIPAPGATGTVTFEGKLGQSYAIAAGSSVTLKYTANRPPATGSFTNAAQAYFGSATTPVATATFQQILPVALSVSKVSTVTSDGISTANPKAIPNAVVSYLIAISNSNPLPVDTRSVLVSDRTPTGMAMCVSDIGAPGTGPVSFIEGSPASTLSYTFLGLSNTTDSIEFSGNGGVSWTYTPVADSTGCDNNITNFRVRPDGNFAGNSSFNLRAVYRIQ